MPRTTIPAGATMLADVGALAPCELTVVMPVYNEQDALEPCVRSWLAALESTGLDHRLLVIDDGSKDGTSSVLDALASDPRVLGISKSNEGHGPTILRGYRLAARTSEWVFQVDSDDEIPAASFGAVWDARAGNDAVFGRRIGRDQSLARALISKVASLTSRIALGGRVADVNVPFRLMRADVLRPLVDAMPDDTFAPNVVIAGVLGRDLDRFAEVPVPHHQRRTGQVSIVGRRALTAAARSFLQTLRLSRTLRATR